MRVTVSCRYCIAFEAMFLFLVYFFYFMSRKRRDNYVKCLSAVLTGVRLTSVNGRRK